MPQERRLEALSLWEPSYLTTASKEWCVCDSMTRGEVEKIPSQEATLLITVKGGFRVQR